MFADSPDIVIASIRRKWILVDGVVSSTSKIGRKALYSVTAGSRLESSSG